MSACRHSRWVTAQIRLAQPALMMQSSRQTTLHIFIFVIYTFSYDILLIDLSSIGQACTDNEISD
jgi:hypothetical protein